MKYKALIVDFDETMARKDLSIANPIKRAIGETIKKGVVVSIATGRPYEGIIEQVCDELQLTDPHIVSAGAKIISPKQKKILWIEYIDSSLANGIIAFLQKKQLLFAVEDVKNVYGPNGDVLGAYGPGVHFKRIEDVTKNIVKIVILEELKQIQADELVRFLQTTYPSLTICKAKNPSMGNIVIDITSKHASKYHAVTALTRILNLKKNEIVGVGDGHNDIGLLEASGIKVALENAPDELKKIADVVFPSCENDGLLAVIERYF